jgi:pentatricopeptide repeat protein
MEMEKKGLVSKRGLCAVVAGNNTLIDMYAKCGFLEEACEVLLDSEMARIGTVVSWNALLAGYAQLGECLKVFHLFHRIIREGLKPSDATFLIILNACSRAGFLYNSCMYFDAMMEVYGISPTIKHVSGMVDLLCRVGDMHNAIQMAKELPACADLAAWHSILGVCRDHGNVALAEDAFVSAMKMNRNDASSYMF